MGSSAVSSARSLLEPTLASNGEPTRGRWGQDEPTLGRATWMVGRPEKVAEPPQTWSGGC